MADSTRNDLKWFALCFAGFCVLIAGLALAASGSRLVLCPSTCVDADGGK